MINIVKKKINMSDELKAKINWSCKFNKKSYQIIGHTKIHLDDAEEVENWKKEHEKN